MLLVLGLFLFWGAVLGARRTFGIELQDLQVHVCVCDDDVQGLLEGHEFGCHAFEMVFAAAEECHFVRLFLFNESES